MIIKYTMTYSRDVLREDMGTLERTQQMMASDVLKEIQIGDEEITVRHNHWVVAQSLLE